MIHINLSRLKSFTFKQKASGKRGKFTWRYLKSERLNRHISFGEQPLYKYWIRFSCPIGGGREMVAVQSVITTAVDVREAVDIFFEEGRKMYDERVQH